MSLELTEQEKHYIRERRGYWIRLLRVGYYNEQKDARRELAMLEIILKVYAYTLKLDFYDRHEWLQSKEMRPEVYCPACVDAGIADIRHKYDDQEWMNHGREKLEWRS